MKLKLVLSRVFFIILLAFLFFLHKNIPDSTPLHFLVNNEIRSRFEKDHEEEEEAEEQRAEYTEERLRHEHKMLRNPVTGKIPANFREIELQAVRDVPSRGRRLYDPRISGITGTTVQNTYQPAGPNNVAGRSRTLGIDSRNPNIMLTGSTTGGIFRTTDGGANWTFVLNQEDIHSVTTIAQDPTHPDTWYCGTGEVFYPPSASDIAGYKLGGGTYGWGIFKSTDNGVTWIKLLATQDNNQNAINSSFDLIHRIVVHPITGYVYAAIHNRIVRSTNGGTSWETILGGVKPNTIFGGMTELYIPANGSKIYAAISGENVDNGSVGVWESSTGNASSWKRIAGGTGTDDSVPGWRAYGDWGRVVLTMNSAATKLFVLYKNNESAADDFKPEADLFRCNVSSGDPASYTWTNLNSYVPDEPGYNRAGIDPYTTQFNGYNMSIAVKPDNDNILFIGGAAMDRVNLAETSD